MKRLLICALVVVVLAVLPAEPITAQQPPALVIYVPPVEGPVVDPFRPPGHIGASGNRGLEYGNQFYAPVGSAADGEVIFAGDVVSSGVVTIQHADGVRTTYTGLTEVWVQQGTYARQGDLIGFAGRNIHFGALIRDHYLDPQILIDASQGTAQPRLIPAPDGP